MAIYEVTFEVHRLGQPVEEHVGRRVVAANDTEAREYLRERFSDAEVVIRSVHVSTPQSEREREIANGDTQLDFLDER